MKDISRLAVAAASIAALTLSACGTTNVDQPAAENSVVAEVQGCDSYTPEASGPIEMTDGVGRSVKLDKPAERVVVLEWQQIEDALTLCLTPVGVSDPEGYSTWVSAEKLPEGVTDIGTRQEPDLDTLYGTNPDLIIVEAYQADEDIVKQLEQRDVPVLVTKGANTDDPIGNMKEVFTTIAEATGRSDRASSVLAEFDNHLAEAKTKVADAQLPTQDFVFFDGWLESSNLTIRPYGEGALFTALGEELGLKGAWTSDVDKANGNGGVDPAYGLAQTDVEGLTAVGEANLFYANDEGAGGYVAALEKNPIWQALPAVADGRAHSFPSGVWGAGGPRSCLQAVDAYVDAIVGK